MAKPVAQITVVVTNPRVLRALRKLRDEAADLVEDQPWNQEVKRLHKLANRAIRYVTLELHRETEPDLSDEPDEPA
jgi:hypothetical protein